MAKLAEKPNIEELKALDAAQAAEAQEGSIPVVTGVQALKATIRGKEHSITVDADELTSGLLKKMVRFDEITSNARLKKEMPAEDKGAEGMEMLGIMQDVILGLTTEWDLLDKQGKPVPLTLEGIEAGVKLSDLYQVYYKVVAAAMPGE